jgi:hypothetical protein
MGCECERGEERINELKSEATNTNTNERDEIHEYITKRLANNNNLSYIPKVLESKPKKEQLEIVNLNKPKDDFSRYLLGLFNSLRLNPKSYIDTILRAKKNIQNNCGSKIYKSSVKVALNSGEKAFDSAIEVLKKTPPMNKLIFNPDLVIDLPTTESDIKYKGYLPNQIKKKINEGFEIKSFWKDVVKDPDACFVLTIVDDNGRNAGNKRNDILDRNIKYIGISSVKIGQSFACYIVLS